MQPQLHYTPPVLGLHALAATKWGTPMSHMAGRAEAGLNWSCHSGTVEKARPGWAPPGDQLTARASVASEGMHNALHTPSSRKYAPRHTATAVASLTVADGAKAPIDTQLTISSLPMTGR